DHEEFRASVISEGCEIGPAPQAGGRRGGEKVDLADFDHDAVFASFLAESELLHNVFRVAHSIKGNAASLELGELTGFAHVVEDLLDIFREQKALPSPELISLLLKAVDELRAMVANAAAGPRELSAEQHSLRKEIAREVEKRSKRVVDVSGVPRDSTSAVKADMLPGANHHTLRVDVGKLDHMLNLTGEIVIAQGRLRRM